MSLAPRARPDASLAAGSATHSAGALRLAWLPTLLGLGLALLALALAFRQEIVEITGIWSDSKTYNFGWVVLPTTAFLLWTRRQEIARSVPRASLWGPALAVVASALWLAGDVLAIAEARHLALAAALLCLALSVLGARGFRRLLPCLLLVPFIVPTGKFLLLPLRHLAIEIVGGYSALTGLDFKHDGFTFFIEGHRYVVVDDCAGLSYLLVGAMLGVTFGALSVLPLWRVVAFAVLGAVLGIAANALRIIAIITYDYFNGTRMELAAHQPFELVAWVLLLVLLLVLHARFGAKGAAETGPQQPAAATPPAASPATPPGTPLRNIALPLACALVLVAGPLLTQNSRALEVPAAVAPAFPDVVGRFALDKNVAAPWRPAAGNGLTQSLAVYSDATGEQVSLFVVRAEQRAQRFSDYSIDFMGPSSPESEWMPARKTREKLCAEAACYEVVREAFLRKRRKEVRHVVWLYRVEGDTTVSLLMLRLRRALAELRGEPAAAELVAVMTHAPDGQSQVLAPEEVVAFLRSL